MTSLDDRGPLIRAAGEMCELAAFGDLEKLQLLIENGVSPNAKVRKLSEV